MATFASVPISPHRSPKTNTSPSHQTFSTDSYAAFRPTYPDTHYTTILTYHQGPKTQCLDLGCGPGIVTRSISPHFQKVIGIDPSTRMISTARQTTPITSYPNLEFRVSSAESLAFIPDASVDLVVSGQAAHWFDFPRLFAELDRVVRKDGTLAIWGYKDHVFTGYPTATEILQRYAYDQSEGALGNYWTQPGRSIVEGKYRVIKPDEYGWRDLQRIEYEPGVEGSKAEEGALVMTKRLSVEECKRYVRTWSAYHGWLEEHPDKQPRDKGGEGDIFDQIFDEIAEKVPEFRDEKFEVDIEWGTVLIMARKRE